MPKLDWKKKDEKYAQKSNYSQNIYEFQVLELIENPIIGSVIFDKDVSKNKRSLNQQHEKSSNSWKNLLIWGENKSIMGSLNPKFSNKINLIYIDPPYATGGNFESKTFIGEGNTFENKKAYSDIWDGGIDEYIEFLYDRLLLMKNLLSKNGSIYVHLDWHVSHYIKVILDEIFGKENFRNEIIWAYPAASAKTRKFFIRSFDSILFYTKSNEYTFNDDPGIYMEYSDRVKFALKEDDKGMFYYRGGSHNGKRLSQKVYVTNKGIFPRDVWTDIPYIRANTLEYQAFSTQKPERLLRRIILASSNKDDIVADFFCGTGTSLAVAEKLGRRWIGSDIAKQAINISRKRIFDVWNSNDLIDWNKKYERRSQPFKIVKNNDYTQAINTYKDFLVENIQKRDISSLIQDTKFVVNISENDSKITVDLVDYFTPNLKLIKDNIKNRIKNFSDWIDSWSIDFNHHEHSFTTAWISYRTLKNRKLDLTSVPYNYEEKGKHKISIKVNDILGIETIQDYEVVIT
ncbi:MAG TPA: site-specific DNA-methyltransferase [Candidatus Nanopelagicaceae bacterium]|nr:site-specific DNA-methyltransferase [Candidatus Nanopelagicaceae bacterium]